MTDDGGDEPYQLHLLDLATAASRPLAAAPGLIHNFGAWSADGRLLSFAASRRDVRFFDVWVINVETGEEFLVVQDDGMNAVGSFVPDGRTLPITRPNLDLPGDNDLYALPLDQGGQVPGRCVCSRHMRRMWRRNGVVCTWPTMARCSR